MKMRHPGGQIVKVKPERAKVLRTRGWTPVKGEDAEQSAGSNGGDPAAPAPSATKAEWAIYAQSIGIDTDGLTKAGIIEAVEAA